MANLGAGWSLSKLKAFDCPLRGYRLYVEKRKEPKGEAAMVGTLCAKLMEEQRVVWMTVDPTGERYLSGEAQRAICEQTCKNEQIPEEHIEKAIRIYQDALESMPDLFPDVEQVKDFLFEVKIAFDHDWERIRFDAADAKFWGTAAQRNATLFRCIPDFAWTDANGVLHIEDDKTGWGQVTPEQVQAYGFCVSKVLGIKPEAITLTYNMLGKKTRQTFPTVDYATVESFPSWLEDKVAKIEALTEFKPVLGKQCDWCGFVDECPAHEKTKEQLTTIDPDNMKAITTKEQAIAGGLWLLAAERCVAAAKDKLKAYVAEHGPVTLPETGKELRLNPSSKWEAPFDEVFEVLLSNDLTKTEVFGNLTLTRSDVEDVLKSKYPLAGKGITAEVKKMHRAARDSIMAEIEAVGKETPRAATFGIFNLKGND